VFEDDAGALSGIEPVKAATRPNGSTWFDKVVRGIRLKGGRGVAVVCDQHSDPLAEALRWQVCEGELVQAMGRDRGVNPTAANPLAIDIVADVVLPLAVDEVVEWTPPGLEVEMEIEGMWLESHGNSPRSVHQNNHSQRQAAKNKQRSKHCDVFNRIH
jgi:putative DNA primase/helicase